MILLDSSIWINVLRKVGAEGLRQDVFELLEAGLVLTCPIVRLEVIGGAKKSERWTIQSYFRDIRSLAITESVWTQAIEVSHRLKDKGVNAPWSDVVIASIGLFYKIPIFAVDKHFEQMAKVVRVRLHQKV